MELDAVSVFTNIGMIVLSWHMMRTWEETQAESEFKKRKIFRGI